MVKTYQIKCFFVLAFGAITSFTLFFPYSAKSDAAESEAKAIEFLIREVPSWEQANGCFSCHNNGDGARALYAASRKGYRIPASALAETTTWVERPDRWDQNKGDPGFSDKRLANIQFAASLLAASDAGYVKEIQPIEQAARKLSTDQGADGAWRIDAGNTVGSPATYGAHLATWMAIKTIKRSNLDEMKPAVEKAEHWLAQATPNNVLTASALMLAAQGRSNQAARLQQERCLKLILSAQTRDGGWGPYADSPPEAFDTALALLALAPLYQKPGVREAIRRGRNFLAELQNSDGSWPATTRPTRGESYAQMISTTGWVALALLETR